ncbi:hypothetical protein FGO68_gene12773 [Halteria grandinella]|uniref:Protein kinase domain-containing protein n=1 Tax=Halteria grandinella TaxID=5974 RepID=A0A8J8NT25_HALGN|nr:hypothetical protein FGO68_gene12773 [Halteria grandinella]
MNAPQMINNYKVIKKLGEGKLVDVFLCFKDEEKSVLKVQKQLKSEIKMCDSTYAFIEEISAHKKARHPFIIEMIESFLWEDENHNFRWCIVLEYADGGDLYEKYYHPKRRIQEKQALNWIAQIALALDHLQKVGIKTYDIKPQNIVIVGEKSGGMAKIGDLRYIKEDYFGRSNVTHTNSSLYFPPEKQQNRDSPNLDIWSLGILFYELLTGGEHPFEIQPNSMDYLSRLPRLELRQNQLVRDNFKDLIKLMIEKDISKRLSVSQLLDQPLIVRKIDGFIFEMMFGEQITDIIIQQTGREQAIDQEKQPQEIVQLPNRNRFEEEKIYELIDRIKNDGHGKLADIVKDDKELMERLEKQKDMVHSVEWNASEEVKDREPFGQFLEGGVYYGQMKGRVRDGYGLLYCIDEYNDHSCMKASGSQGLLLKHSALILRIMNGTSMMVKWMLNTYSQELPTGVVKEEISLLDHLKKDFFMAMVSSDTALSNK